MITVSILYPAAPGSSFDMAYYLQRHMPMSIARLSAHPGYRGVSVERGLAGTEPGSPPAFVAACHYRFASVDDFVAAFLPHAADLQGDMPRYTDIVPVIQFSEVEIALEADQG